MIFSQNTTREDFILNETHRSLFIDDASYIPFYNENLGQSSLNGLYLPPDLIDISNHHQLNHIPSTPPQTQDSFNQNLLNTQNHLVFNSPSYGIPSDYSFLNIDTYEESMNNITNNNNISANPKGIFENIYDLQGRTLWDENVHNVEFTKSVCVPALDQMMGEPQSFDMPVPEDIKNTTSDIMNQGEGQKMVRTHQKKNKKIVETSNHSKETNIIKGKWAKSEDMKLNQMVEQYDGIVKWTSIAKNLKGRTGKQCRERWHNHLRPGIKKTAWTEEENQILVAVHKVVGTKWYSISQHLPGRTENNIKNRWNATKRRVQNQSGENSNLADNNVLENYIRYVTINNDNLSKTTEDVNLNMDVGTQTNEPLVNASTTSYYVPMPENFTWENYITEF
ncbi:transcription factor MYB115 [Capsella rubella]|nr:transcription factor MYB115 [Capsella rubella]